MSKDLNCKCNESLIKSLNGTTKVRSKIILFKGDQSFIVCKSCGSETEAPLKLVEPKPNPPLVISTKKRIYIK